MDFNFLCIYRCAAAIVNENPCRDNFVRNQYENECNYIRRTDGCFANCYGFEDPVKAFEVRHLTWNSG